jgi:predicted ribosome quality control (RQC) complex YloA/Tae2 family protein
MRHPGGGGEGGGDGSPPPPTSLPPPQGVFLKLARTGDDGDKAFLLLEPGARFHTVAAPPTLPDAPSGFALKLRKHVRGRRLEDVRQLGCDRLLDCAFGGGEGTHHVLLEMYAAGNLVLTDSAYKVLTLLRSHKDDVHGATVQANRAYPLGAVVRARRALTAGGAVAALVAGAEAGATINAALTRVLPHGPAVAEHVALAAGAAPGAPAPADPPPSLADALAAAAAGVEAWIDACEAGTVPAAFLTTEADKPKKKKKETGDREGDATAASAPPPSSDLVYDSFEAFPLAQLAGRATIPASTLDAAADLFFSRVDGQRAAAAKAAREAAAQSRVHRIRADQGRRAGELEAEAARAEAGARALEARPEAADAVVDALNAALARGMSWRDVERLVAAEAAAGNPVAGAVRGLALERNMASIELPAAPGDEDEASTVIVDLDLGLRAAANARALFAARRSALAKLDRTKAGHAAALAAAEAKVTTTLASAAARDAARAAARSFKPLWFQKFDWCVTSEGFLVLAGRDAGQNELLVRKHLKGGDAYVHADVHGGATVVLKNRRGPRVALPPLSLAQAGDFAVCKSAAWTSKVVARAWWVGAAQVSRAPPSGEYLAHGAFVIRGKKTFLPPSRLEMGLTFLFRLDDACVAAHAGERCVRGEEEEGEGEAGAPPSGGDGDAPHPLSSSPSGGDGAAPPPPSSPPSSASSDDVLDALDAPDPLARAVVVEDEEEVEAVAPPPAPPALPGARRKPSVAERRAMKKHGVTDVADLPLGALERKAAADDGAPKPASAPAPVAQPPPAAPPRGKKSKAKKAASRYADQDEEERALAHAALAADGVQRGPRERRADRKAAKASKQAAGVVDAGPTEAELAAVGAVARVERAPRVERQAAAAAAAAAPPPPDSDSDPDDDAGGATGDAGEELDAFTFAPLSADTLLQAIPMCAPLSALAGAPHRVKITPGTGKRGRVGKAGVELIARSAGVSARLRELVRHVPDTDVALAAPGNGKVSAPGAAKLAAEARGQKKKGKAAAAAKKKGGE